MNADPVTAMIFYEQIARGSVGFTQSVCMNILMGTYFIYRFGTEEIKKRCLYPAMKGEKVATICFTEDQSGSDLSATKTTARKEGKQWVLNGTKMWITNGPLADMATVLATTDLSLGAKGLNFFLVEKGTPGLLLGTGPRQAGLPGNGHRRTRVRQREGPRGEPFGKRDKQGDRVPGRDTGRSAGNDRGHGLGIAQAAFDEGLEYARKRVAFGKQLAATSLSGQNLQTWPRRWRRAGC